jgi:hypothetical protein
METHYRGLGGRGGFKGSARGGAETRRETKITELSKEILSLLF